MIIGMVLALAGAIIWLAGCLRFNFGIAAIGVALSIAGAAVCLSHVVEVWL